MNENAKQACYATRNTSVTPGGYPETERCSEPIDAHTTPLIVRGQSGPSSLFTILVRDPVIFTMERRMLLRLKARAKGQPDALAALMAIAQLGWAATGIAVAGLFLSQRRRWAGWLPRTSGLWTLRHGAWLPQLGKAARVQSEYTGTLIFASMD